MANHGLENFVLDIADEIESVIATDYADVEAVKSALEGLLEDIDTYINEHFVIQGDGQTGGNQG
jgi:hypothetical protein